MNINYRQAPIPLAILLAFPLFTQSALAAEPYPSLPPTLSTSVTPNVLLHVDNSGSMGNYPPSGGMKKKIEIARDVATALVDKNQALRWGLFSFDPSSNDTGGILQAPIGSSIATVKSKIAGLTASTWTPLGETLFEITRYFSGGLSYFSKTVNTDASKRYASPIQYRCQKNFAIIITDGVSTKDDKLPGLPGFPAVSYTSYDSNTQPITRTFQVCTSTSTASSVSCPATLEGASSPTAFKGTSDDSSSWGRTVRDVAAYAYDMDLVTGGNDLDGKSFNDPKFAKQNLQTYTVGFAVDDPVLKATATVGHGKYYISDDEKSLTTALTNAVNDIVSSVSNAGGTATERETTTSGNKVFQPVFNPNGWYGELRCYYLGNNNTIGSPCSPNAKAVVTNGSGRRVYSSVVSTTGVTTPFDFQSSDAALTTMTSTLSTYLGTSATERKNLISFLRGGEGISGFRTRPNGFLGDIIDGQPVVIGKPAGTTTDADYETYRSSNTTRDLVAIGANDGMLHIFSGADMIELLGYVPSAVYPHLTALAAIDYGLSGGTPHTYHVNGSLRQADIKVAGNWKTILAGGLGQGGRGYFGLDVSNTSTFGSPSGTVKWEKSAVSNSSIGYTFGTPIIYNVRTSATTVTPAVILPNGYENSWDGTTSSSSTSSLLIVNAYTGNLIREISVPAGSAGLSSPAGADYGQDGILDYIYAGDMSGKVWRFNLTSDSPSGFSVTPNPIFDAGVEHPVTMRPAIRPVNRSSDGTPIGNLVIFGTGKLLTDSDRQDKTQQTLFGILDDLSDSPQTITPSELQQQSVTGTASLDSNSGKRVGTYRKVSDNTLDLTSPSNTKKGWFLNLPTPSERLVASPMLYEDKVLFGTGIPVASEKCLPGGQGWIMGLNPLTGGITKSATGKKFSFIDMNNDGKSSDADKIVFSGGDATPEFVSGFQKDGIPTELAYVAKDSKIVTSTTTGSLGNIGSVIALREANSQGIYIGNGKFDGKATITTRGNAMPMPGSPGAGTIMSGVIGKDSLDTDQMLTPSSGVKVETTIWRELK